MERPYPACDHVFADGLCRLFRQPLLALAVVAMLSAWGCDSDDDDAPVREDAGTEEPETEPIELLDNAAVLGTSYLAMVDQRGDQAFVLDLSEGRKLLEQDANEEEDSKEEQDAGASETELLPLLKRSDIEPNPLWVERRQGDKSQALILSAGRRGVGQPAVLTRLSADGKATEYEVGAPFDAMLQAEDGSLALLYYEQGSDELVFNTDELAIVDLGSEDKVTRKTVEIPRGQRTAIALSPVMDFDNRETFIAVLLSEAYVTLVDLDKPGRTPTRVRLRDVEGKQAVQPEQVVFSKSGKEIYVRAKNSDDVFVLTLRSRDGDEKDFQTSFGLLPLGEGASDIALYDDGDSEHLVVLLPNSAEAHIIDLDAPADEPEEPVVVDLETDADRVILFEAGDPEDADEDEWRALLYKRESRQLGVLDLEDEYQSLQTARVSAPISEVLLLEEHNLALLLHEESSEVDVFDLVERTFSKISVGGSIKKAIYSTEQPRLWVAPAGQHFLSYVDLDTRRTGEVLLDERIQELVVLPDKDLVVAIHDREEGSLTVLDAKKPSRDTAARLRGFAEAEPFEEEEKVE